MQYELLEVIMDYYLNSRRNIFDWFLFVFLLNRQNTLKFYERSKSKI